MIGYLFRANSNNSGIYITKFYDSNNKSIIIKKSAFTKSSILRLRRELKGVSFYSSNTGDNLLSSYIDLPNYFSINFNYIEGKKVDYRNGYWINKNYIERAINKYCEIWSSSVSDNLFSHGDYSLDNIIFTDNSEIIIDWEHFSNSFMPIGFDALNLIYEQLYILMSKKKINDETIQNVNLMFKNLHAKKCLDKCFWKKPLLKLQELIYYNKDIWGNQISKLPVMKITDLQVKDLDQMIYLQ